MKKFLNNKKGFTLIEMVIVIVIIAILAAILVPNLLTYIDNANDKKLMGAGDTIHKTIAAEIAEMYKDGINVNTASTDDDIYDDAFWQKISDSTSTDVGPDDTHKYFANFTVENNKIASISVTQGDKIAELKSGIWKISEVE